MTAPVRVFVSYSWDTEPHKQRVLELAQRLRREGIDARLDRLTDFPSEGWAQWMVNQVRDAAFVLVVATEKYRERFERNAAAGTGLGATWEGAVITQELYEEGARTTKFIPVVFTATEAAHIPTPLRGFTRYKPADEDGYDALYRLLTFQPALVPEQLGIVRKLESRTGVADAGVRASDAVGELASLPLPELSVHDHVLPPNNLPRLTFFFGREKELETIDDALAPDARTWGALIDGPGGIGKTSLAIRAAELTPPNRFRRIVFLSTKEREMTPHGERALNGFVLPGWLQMLNELASQLGRPELARSTERERSGLLLRLLESENALLILDNLESLPDTDRDLIFTFLSRLPRSCKALVTSRRRSDIDARIVRLQELNSQAALEFIAELAKDRPRLAEATEVERNTLYREAGGNPLVIRWLAGQLGRGRCVTVAGALDFLRSAPAGNDPLEFVFGDLVDTFTQGETIVLAALAHFTVPMDVNFIAHLAGVSEKAASGALESLVSRALVTMNAQGHFGLTLLVADFIRSRRPEVMKQTGTRLTDRAFSLIVQNGMHNYERFTKIDNAWAIVDAALPLFVQGPNSQLQVVAYALGHYFEYYGHWDEWLALARDAQDKAVANGDPINAALRAKDCGWVSYLRGQTEAVFEYVTQALSHLPDTKLGAQIRRQVIRLRGCGHELNKNYAAALADYRLTLKLSLVAAPKSAEIAICLNVIAYAERLSGDFSSSLRNYRDGLRIAKAYQHQGTIDTISANLAELALAQENWLEAESLSRKALALAETRGRKELIAWNCRVLGAALARQNRKLDALPYARRAVELYITLGSLHLTEAQHTYQECAGEHI